MSGQIFPRGKLLLLEFSAWIPIRLYGGPLRRRSCPSIRLGESLSFLRLRLTQFSTISSFTSGVSFPPSLFRAPDMMLISLLLAANPPKKKRGRGISRPVFVPVPVSGVEKATARLFCLPLSNDDDVGLTLARAFYHLHNLVETKSNLGKE